MNKFKVGDIVCIKKMTDEEILDAENRIFSSSLSSWRKLVQQNCGIKTSIRRVENYHRTFLYNVGFRYDIPEELLRFYTREIKVEGLE